MNIRFFVIILSLTLILAGGLFSWSAYEYYRAIHADDPIDPTLRVELGSGKIIRWDDAILLGAWEEYILENSDAIETERESKATITWPDHSITRLGADTRIVISKMAVSQSYDSIQISYDIERGKVWNSVIRLLLGDSYFEAHLPKDSIVAWVRGTTFEVNLVSSYIHAVDHATRLRDRSGRYLDLLPWELVSSENIWVRKWREWLDTTWTDWNTRADTAYTWLRSSALETRTLLLSGKTETLSWLDAVWRWILSHISGYESLSISRALDTGDLSSLKEYGTDTLLEYYQKASSIASPESRDALRTTILKWSGIGEWYESLRALLERSSIWDSINTGKIMPSAERLLKNSGINMKSINTTGVWTRVLDGAKDDTKKLLESLSGSLRWVMGF